MSDNTEERLTYQDCIRRVIEALAPAFGIDPRLACEIVRLESSFRPWAIGDEDCIRRVIEALAPAFGVDPQLACEIVRLESSFRPWAIGDDGKAVGIWQWHYTSWVYARRRMAQDGFGIVDVEADKRADVFESTITALYAIGRLGLARWWSTYKIALANLAKRDVSCGPDGDQR